VSEVAGRGVGMDVVNATVTRLGGTLDLDSAPGRGASFTMRLPMTLALSRALLVLVGTQTYAIPLGSVSQILRVERDQIERIGGEQVVRIAERTFPIRHLRDALGIPPEDGPERERLAVVILKVGVSQTALVTDGVLQEREIVIKSLGSHLRHVRGILGATIMGDGSVVAILNPMDLVPQEQRAEIPVVTQRRTELMRALRASETGDLEQPKTVVEMPVAATVIGKPPAAPPRQGRTQQALAVMFVDDSPSVRRVLSNLVVNAGWQPIAAKDGLDALEILQSSPRKPSVILLDVEMPRMDGYELLMAMKEDAALSAIPVVMVTSRAGEKHRRKALSLGASEYVSKPYDDETLSSMIRRLAAGGA
jgi:CheY-like chemotaxis protein/chemotaxis signal transduction protein